MPIPSFHECLPKGHEQLTPFGGLLAMIKFLDLIDFAQIFQAAYHAPVRQPKLGHYKMVIGLLMLLFIGGSTEFSILATFGSMPFCAYFSG